jgi:hypothetical protein
MRNEGRWDVSNVRYDSGRVLAYDKRSPGPEMDHIDYGLSALSAAVIQRLPAGETAELADLFAGLARDGVLAGHEVTERFYEIGSPAGLRDTIEYFERRTDA